MQTQQGPRKLHEEKSKKLIFSDHVRDLSEEISGNEIQMWQASMVMLGKDYIKIYSFVHHSHRQKHFTCIV